MVGWKSLPPGLCLRRLYSQCRNQTSAFRVDPVILGLSYITDHPPMYPLSCFMGISRGCGYIRARVTERSGRDVDGWSWQSGLHSPTLPQHRPRPGAFLRLRL